ncbi:hypothetical protein RchiOBHm_Chr2g0124581 [Rosa chinensis]|uniref:Uncharacterized protein n=1 Tax=Rosa chinensis TaxID=74649 RepID=A0A2P6RTB3_ROSCH|nr:hypothetical protein RchiOBHm_Chr2g0124581 [Rosa chinensis]
MKLPRNQLVMQFNNLFQSKAKLHNLYTIQIFRIINGLWCHEPKFFRNLNSQHHALISR